MIKVVVFDLDDTLISEKEYIKSGYSHIAKIISNNLNKSKEEVFNDLILLFKENPLNVFNRLYEKYNFKYEKKDIMYLVNEYRNHIPNIKFFDDVICTFIKLRNEGIKLGLITDGYKETQRNKIKVLDLEKYMDYIIVTDELGREFWKPHQKSFIMMKEYFDVEFEQMAYIGDNPKKDFKAGNELGMLTIMINRKDKIYIDEKKEKIFRCKRVIDKMIDI